MVILVTRAIYIRVLPESLIEFRYFPSEAGDGNSWISRIKKGWAEEKSLLSWGNRGRWYTVETTDKEKWREGNRFRIGFEPLFVDFTKSGIWFVLFSFFKVRVGLTINFKAAKYLVLTKDGLLKQLFWCLSTVPEYNVFRSPDNPCR